MCAVYISSKFVRTQGRYGLLIEIRDDLIIGRQAVLTNNNLKRKSFGVCNGTEGRFQN